MRINVGSVTISWSTLRHRGQLAQHAYRCGQSLSLTSRRMQDEIKLVRSFVDDLLTSWMVTVAVYFLSLAAFYLLATRGHLHDQSTFYSQPQQLYSACNTSATTPHSRHNRPPPPGHPSRPGEGHAGPLGFSDEMLVLSALVGGMLNRTNHVHFVCYRSLFEELRLRAGPRPDRLDICLYDSELNSASMLQNVAHQFGFYFVDMELTQLQRSHAKLAFTFDSLYGYYHVSYGASSHIYLYLFAYSLPNSMTFATVHRYGFVYLQMSYLLQLFSARACLDGKASLAEQQCDDNVPALHSLSLLSALPAHMVDSRHAAFTFTYANVHFKLALDSYTMLMYFYPNTWWLSVGNCTL